MARQDFPDCRFRFFSLQPLWSGGSVYGHCNTSLPPPHHPPPRVVRQRPGRYTARRVDRATTKATQNMRRTSCFDEASSTIFEPKSTYKNVPGRRRCLRHRVGDSVILYHPRSSLSHEPPASIGQHTSMRHPLAAPKAQHWGRAVGQHRYWPWSINVRYAPQTAHTHPHAPPDRPHLQ